MKSWLRTILLAFLVGILIGLVRLHRMEKAVLVVRGNALTATTPSPVVPRKFTERAQTVPAAQLPETPAADPQRIPRNESSDARREPEAGPGLSPELVLQNLRSVFRDYSARFGGNPIGTNREITSRLNGGNRKRVVFLKLEDGMRLNELGELVDNWGTPFFFHQISNTEMEIHSAGPDRLMWTADDLVVK